MKDPAVLFFISDWLTSTSEMDADCRGWYLNLILHNYDKKDLPNDIEKLAVLANVKFSEYERFEQVFEQVLKQKFEQTSNNRLTNLRTQTILKNREIFSDKRSEAGKLSYIMRYMSKHHSVEYKDKGLRDFIKSNIDLTIDIKSEQVLEQVFKQVFELYRNGNGNININTINRHTLLEEVTTSDIQNSTELIYFQTALSFYKLFKRNSEELNVEFSNLKNAKYQEWVEPIKKLFEIDKRTGDEFREVFEFLKVSEFWKVNIRSTAKLRKKNKDKVTYFEELLIKSRNNGKRNNKGGATNQEVAEIIARTFADQN